MSDDTPISENTDSSLHGSVPVTGMYKDWFLDYASYVILERAVPAIEDGLKPVQRRILHAMKEMDDGRFNKVANIIGQSMQYHPHGDASIGDAIVNMGQKDLLIETQGNWGDVRTGDGAAAARYIEARLSKFALDVVFNPQTTDWQLSYDGRKREPVTLPVKFPLLLAQGVEGIAVGLSTKILPHNFRELIEASIETGVKRVVALSTDKASSPINLYGATKLTADKLFVAANNYSFSYGTSFSVVRYGNVMGSRGSVIPFFRKLAEEGKPLPITDLRMTRFWISIDEAVNFIVESLDIMDGGELYVPRIPSMKIVDLAAAVSPTAELQEIGMRPGEKLHEEMISADDSRRTLIYADRLVVQPVVAEWGFKVKAGGKAMVEGVAYRSDTNDSWMSENEIRKFIAEIRD